MLKPILIVALTLFSAVLVQATPYSVTPQSFSAQVASSISIDYTVDVADPLHNSGGGPDHIGLWQTTDAIESHSIAFLSLSAASGTWTFTLPLATGTFEVREFKGEGNANLAAKSLPITIGAPAIIARNPNQILVVYNSDDADSTEVANYYKAARSVPTANMLGIALGAAAGVEETVAWATVTGTIIPAIRTKLTTLEASNKIYYIELMYRMPYYTPDAPLLVSSSVLANGLPPGTGPFNGQCLCSHLMDPFYDAESAYNTLAATQLLNDNPIRGLIGFLYQGQPEVNVYYNPLALSSYRQLAGAFRIYSCTHLDSTTKAKAKAIVDHNLAAEAAGGPSGIYYFNETWKRADLNAYYTSVPDDHAYLTWDGHRANEMAIARGLTTVLTEGISATIYGAFPAVVAHPNAAFYYDYHEFTGAPDGFSLAQAYVAGSVAVIVEEQNSSFRTGTAGAENKRVRDALTGGADAVFAVGPTAGGAFNNYWGGMLLKSFIAGKALGDAQMSITGMHWAHFAIGEGYYQPKAPVLPTPSPTPTPPAPAAGCTWFVSGSGTVGVFAGNGSIGSPWTMRTLFNGDPGFEATPPPAAIKAGDVICWRAGTYQAITGNNTVPLFHTVLAGTASAPITFQPYPGERVIIDTNGIPAYNDTANQSDTVILEGAGLIFKGFEITNSSTDRTSGRPGAVGSRGSNVKVLNNIIHDTGGGVGKSDTGQDDEFYGNVMFNIGWDDRTTGLQQGGTGHAMYVQNQTGFLKIYDNVVSNTFGYGLHAYVGGSAHLNNFDVQRNAFFNNGYWTRVQDSPYTSEGRCTDNYLFGSASPPVINLTFKDNFGYHRENRGCNNFEFGYGGAANTSALAQNNTMIGGINSFAKFATMNLTNNVMASSLPFLARMPPVAVVSETVNNNTYYYYPADCGTPTPFSNDGGDTFISSTAWKALGFDAASTFNPCGTRPPVKVTVRPNAYDTNRAHVFIENLASNATVTVNLSSFLSNGDTYELHNAQDYYGPLVATGTYSAPITINMTTCTVATPVGYNAATMTPLSKMTSCPQFGAFILLRNSGAPATQPLTTPPLSPAALASNNQVSLTWAALAGATSYKVKRGTTTGVYTVTFSGIAGTSYLDVSAVNGQQYFYVIVGTNSVGDSPASSEVTATPGAPVPIAPSNLVLTNTTTPTIVATFADNSNNETGTALICGLGASPSTFAQVGSVGANVTTVVYPNPAFNTTYTCYLVAFNNSGSSLPTAKVTILTVPAPPTGLNGSVISSSQINWAWTSTAATFGFEQCSGVGCASFVQTFTPATTSQNVTGLGAGTAYSVRVRAQNASGFGPYSAVATATTLPIPVPNAPTSPAAAPGDAQVSLTWVVTQNTINYKVFRRTSGSYNFASPLASPVGNSYLDSTASNGVLYHYVIEASNGSGDSAPSVEVSATPAAPVALPSAPTSPVATGGNAQVSLTWAATANTVNYKVFRSTTSGVYNYASPLASPVSNSYLDTTTSNGTPYFYVIRASNAAGDSASSTEVTATPAVPGVVPPAPTGFVGSAGAAQTVLNWNVVGTATSYKVFRALASGGYNYAAPLGTPSSNTYTDSTPLNGTPYFYVIRAVNGIGDSASSSEITLTPQAVPAAPTGVAAVTAVGQITISWNASGGATSYKVFRSTTTGGYNYASSLGTPAGTSYVDNTAVNGTLYFYVVRAVNASGDSLSSLEVSGALPVPSAPTGFVGTAGNTTVVLNWNVVATATSYKVYKSTTSGVYGAALASPTANTYTATGLTNGVPLFFVVKATNTNGDSVASSEVTATPMGVPVAPTGFAVNTAGGVANLSWNASAGATGYKLCRGTISGGENCASPLATPSGLVYSDNTVVFGQIYWYVIRAVNAQGDSLSSLEVSAAFPGTIATPTNLAVGATTENSIATSWTNGQAYEHVHVESCPGQNCLNFVEQVSLGNVMTFNDTPLPSSSYRRYRIRGDVAGVFSNYSNIVTSRTTVAAPTVLIGNANGPYEALLSWKPNAQAPILTSVSIERKVTGVGSFVVLVANGNILSTFADDTVLPLGSYDYRLQNFDLVGGSVYSNTVTVVMPAPGPSVPGTPINFRAKRVSSTSVELTWVLTLPRNESGVKIEKSTDGVNWTSVLTTGAGVQGYSLISLSVKTTFYFRVRATNAAGDSANSNVDTATTTLICGWSLVPRCQ